MFDRLKTLRASALRGVLILGLACATTVAWAQDKVVYHINNAEAQATAGLRNIRNHLDVAPKTQIVARRTAIRPSVERRILKE